MDKNKMGVWPIPKLLITMSLPMILAMMVQATYNVVDSIFVGQLGEDALKSVSLAFPLQLMVVAAFVGLGVGINSNISRRLGEKDEKTATLVAEHGYLIGLILFVLVAMGVFFSRNFFEAYSDNQGVIDNAVIYINIILLFSFGRILAQTGMSVMQGTGDMVKPMIAQLVGALVNIILDPFFIFGWLFFPELGVKGAAIATVLGQIVSMIITFIMIFYKKDSLKLNLKEFKFRPKIALSIIGVGLPSSIMQGLGAVMVGGLNYMISPISETAVAVFGVYFRSQSFVFMPVFGLAIGTLPIIGYNYGAKEFKRLFDAVKYAIIMAVSYMSIGFLVFQLFPKQLLKMFNSTPDMMEIGVHAFRTISLVFPIVGISIILSTAFQAFGKAYYSLGLSIIRQLLILLPAAYILVKVGGLDAIWYCFSIAEVLGLMVTIPLFIVVYKNSVKKAKASSTR